MNANIFDLANQPEFIKAQILDREIFQALRLSIGNDQDFSGLIHVYIASTATLLEAIQRDFANQNFDGCILAVHALKSTSASIGAIRLSQASRYIEKIAKPEISTEILDFLTDEYNKVIAAIQVSCLELCEN